MLLQIGVDFEPAPVQIPTATDYEPGVPGGNGPLTPYLSGHCRTVRGQGAHVGPEPASPDLWDHLGEKGQRPPGATCVKCQRIAVRHRHGAAMGAGLSIPTNMRDSSARYLVRPTVR